MTEKTWRHITGWAGVLVGLVAAVMLMSQLRWLINPIMATLAPFVIAFLIAFLLNPALTHLERKGLSRTWSLVLISLVFLLLFGGAIFLWVPKLVEQVSDLGRNMPAFVATVEHGLNDLLTRAEPLLRRANLPTTIPGLTHRFSEQIQSFSTSALTAVSGFAMASVGKMTWLFIIPMVTIWLLMNWNSQRDRFHGMLPGEHRARAMHVLESVGTVLNSYVRGALLLAVCYGVTTALVLGLVFRMPYSLVLGLVAGLVSPIPYIGSIVILLSTGAVAYATNPSIGYVLAVLIAMTVQNNVLFDNIVAPRVLGGSVGLSLPLSIFALMLGGSLFGVAGMILAVPVGATIRVLLMEFFPKLKDPGPENRESEGPNERGNASAHSP